MAINDFLTFAASTGATVLTQAQYAALGALANGFQVGVADEFAVNKVLRQSSTMAAVLAQFIADRSGSDVRDDGNVASKEALLFSAINAAATGRLQKVVVFATPGTVSYTPDPVTKELLIFLVAGGGGGAGCGFPPAGQCSVAAGGDAGTYGFATLPLVPPSAAISVTVGAGGTPGGASVGGNPGGTTSFGSLFSVTGGIGGFAGFDFTPPHHQGQSNGVYGTRFTGAFGYVILGESGIPGLGLGTAIDAVLGGAGGSSPFGAGAPASGSGPGLAGRGYGGGGAGASAAAGAGPYAGGAGAGGLALIVEIA